MEWTPRSLIRKLFAAEYGASKRLIPRWLFLRALGLIYFSAFYSLVFQIRGLIGPQGILPAGDYLQAVARSGVAHALQSGHDPAEVEIPLPWRQMLLHGPVAVGHHDDAEPRRSERVEEARPVLIRQVRVVRGERPAQVRRTAERSHSTGR